MLDYQKDLKNTSIIHHTYYHVLFCEMLFLLKIVLVIYLVIIKRPIVLIYCQYVYVVSACLRCEH